MPELPMDAAILAVLREARKDRRGPVSARWIATRLEAAGSWDGITAVKVAGRLRRLDGLGLVGQDPPGYQQSASTWWYLDTPDPNRTRSSAR